MRVRYAGVPLQGGGRSGATTEVLPPRPAGGAALPSFVPAGYATAPGPRRADPAALHTLSGESMGTTWRVRLGNPRFAPLEPVRAAIDAALGRVVQQMSHWKPDSDLSRFNRAAAGTWHTLPDEFFTVLQCAFDWSQRSGGAWDPTVGPLVDLWGFGPGADPQAGPVARIPSPQALSDARARVGHGRIALQPARRQARQPGGAQLDLSGIAKGYAVDCVAQHLQAQGWTDFLVEVGGELRASGRRPDGQPWRVAVADPAGHAPRALVLQGMAVATSGDLWHAFDHAGRRYSHTIDPRTGEPVHHALASVTVLHAECMQADALATVITVLGPQDGLDFARWQGLAALVCERTPRGLSWAATPAFEALAGA
ncbi:FAD:protein FMN transferase [Acidovorax sp. SUPP950]|nr:FAD:protein FMN transferase [Acidovorax sp. SUPP950]